MLLDTSRALGTSKGAKGLAQSLQRHTTLCVCIVSTLSGAPCSKLQHSLAPVIRPPNSSTAAVSTVAAEAGILAQDMGQMLSSATATCTLFQ